LDAAELQESAADAADFLKALANESRLLILCNLAEGEKSVGELQELIDLSQSALSQHLAVLRRDGLVQTRKSAQTVYYCLASDATQAIMGTLYEYFCKGGKANGAKRKH
jgi:DNA-binding transcriptional ArsR family regulator